MIQPDKIIIADDHPLFRQALLGTLKPKFVKATWYEAQTISELELHLSNHKDCDVVLLDLNIPGGHGFNNLVNIRHHYPQIPVIMISAHEDNDTISKAVEFGASGFIPKSTPVEQILQAIVQVLSGDVWLPSHYQAPKHTGDNIDIADRVASLTQQQHRILMMFAEGMLNKQIAYDLNVSEATIKAHATAIFKKLNVRNRTQAVIAIGHLDIAEQNPDS